MNWIQILDNNRIIIKLNRKIIKIVLINNNKNNNNNSNIRLNLLNGNKPKNTQYLVGSNGYLLRRYQSVT